ncbi:MAG: hypothetical protein Q7R52_01045 [archaeon]|nr:hypothetical protein [archaeon]
MKVIKKVLINKDAIEEELVDSDILIINKVQPYYSLDCFRKVGYDIKHCEETCPQNVFYRCLKIFA